MTAWPPQQQPMPPRQRPGPWPSRPAARVVASVLLMLTGALVLGGSVFALTAIFDQLGEPEYPPDMVPAFLEILMALAIFGPSALAGMGMGLVGIYLLQKRL